jgi:hypothetical protein
VESFGSFHFLKQILRHFAIKFNGTSGPKLLEGLFVLISRKEKARFLKRAFSHS